MPEKPIIELQDVNFSYNHTPAVSGITFEIDKGDYAGIIGPNGGGKTTLLKIMLGLLTPNTGTVKLFGQDIRQFHDWAKIGYLPQRAAHIDVRFPISVYEVVGQGRVARAGLFKRYTAPDYEAIEAALRMGGIEDLKDRLVADLSGGERQRVFIARALASQPDVLILDEPVAGVDVGSQSKFYKFLQDLNKHHGITIVFVSHDIDIIANEASKLICVNHTLVCHGDTGMIFREKRNVLENLYGESVRFMFQNTQRKP